MKTILVLLVALIGSLNAELGEIVRNYHNSKLHLKDGVVNVTVSGSTTSFFAIGDWGGIPDFPYRTPIEMGMAKQMSQMAETYNTQFQMALGDNFYFTGVKNEFDKRFQQTFESVFDSKTLNTPWFMLMGNHDHYGNASAQIAYSKYSQRWMLPDYNYTIYVKTNNGNQDLVGILMIDTVLLCGNTGYDNEHRQPEFESLKDKMYSTIYLRTVEDQIKQIASSSVSYILVAGHFPVWSAAEHGPTKCLVNNLRPLLHKYKVSAYLCGHDHNLQHISDNYLGATVEYFVTGAANVNTNTTAHINDIPSGSLKFFWEVDLAQELTLGGGSFIQASPSNLTLTYFGTNGKSVYQKVIYPRQQINKSSN